jgi:hypothetical protein
LFTVYEVALPAHTDEDPLISADGNGLMVTVAVADDEHPAPFTPVTFIVPVDEPHLTVTVVAEVEITVPLVTVNVLAAPPVAVYVWVEFSQAVKFPVMLITGAVFTVMVLLELPLHIEPFNVADTEMFKLVAPALGVTVMKFEVGPET